MGVSVLRSLIEKYSVSGPRYTSYPTAPQFHEGANEADYRKALQSSLNGVTEPIALYVHLPFCESLCYYCGCNIQITNDKTRSARYVEKIVKELRTIGECLGTRHSLSQIAWGGGTPTFLTLDEIETVQKTTLDVFKLAPGAEVSVEIDPRVTSQEQLRLMRELGFTRVSLGVQDFHPDVQKLINRVQSKEMTASMLSYCRSLGYTGINFDLIYGLPLQTLETFKQTIHEVIELKPDRIAFYNYAHLPSLRPHQKILEKQRMPDAEERVQIFETAYDAFLSSGYRAIGMDHFALANDELFKAIDKGTLYRNFQGYTIKRGAALLGVGASAIGEVGDHYFQNVREPKDYEERIEKTGLATLRGCSLTADDVERKWIIQSLMCGFRLKGTEYKARFHKELWNEYPAEQEKLTPFVKEGILSKIGEDYFVTDLGRLFVRNIAMVFDAYLKKDQKATYSKTV